MAAGRSSMVVFMLVVAAVMQLQGIKAQTTHIVGGSMNWGIPSSGAAAYSTWASQQTFAVGDILVFNFPTGVHDVAEVTQANFDSCNATTPLSMSTTGPTSITLAAGSHYFICTFASHCDLGQKVAISASSTTPPPAPAPATPPPTPTPATPPPTPTPATPPPTPAPATPPPSPTPAPTTTPPPSSSPTPAPTTTPPPSPAPGPTTPSPPTSTPGPATSPPSPAPATPPPALVPSPPGATPPPPPNSAPSFTVAALPVAFLSIAFAFLY